MCGAQLHLVKHWGACITGELIALFEADAHRRWRLAYIRITLRACVLLLLDSYAPIQGSSLFIPHLHSS